jgi:hypothetical protein
MQTPADTWITTPSLIDLWILEVASYQWKQAKLKQGDTPSEG